MMLLSVICLLVGVLFSVAAWIVFCVEWLEGNVRATWILIIAALACYGAAVWFSPLRLIWGS